jgi:hypothetical protein
MPDADLSVGFRKWRYFSAKADTVFISPYTHPLKRTVALFFFKKTRKSLKNSQKHKLI